MTRHTSTEAYYSISDLGKRERTILQAFEDHPDKTDQEITHLLGATDPNFVRPRRKELYDKGYIRDSGARICNVTGKKAYCWHVTTLGKETLQCNTSVKRLV